MSGGRALAGRLAALGLLLALVALVVVLAVVPLARTYLEQREAIADKQALVLRLDALGRRSGALEAELRGLEARSDIGRFTLTAQSPSLAAAELQRDVKAVVERSGGRLTSTQVLAAEDAGDFRRVSVNVRLTADTVGLQQVLHALETRVPVLVVDELMVISRRQRAASRQGNPSDDVELDVRFRLSGFMTATPEARQG